MDSDSSVCPCPDHLDHPGHPRLHHLPEELRGDQRGSLSAVVIPEFNYVQIGPRHPQVAIVHGHHDVRHSIQESLGEILVQDHIHQEVLHSPQRPTGLEQAPEPRGDGPVRAVAEAEQLLFHSLHSPRVQRVRPRKAVQVIHRCFPQGMLHHVIVVAGRRPLPPNVPFVQEGVILLDPRVPGLGQMGEHVADIHLEPLQHLLLYAGQAQKDIAHLRPSSDAQELLQAIIGFHHDSCLGAP